MKKTYLQIMLITLLGMGSLGTAYAAPFAYITNFFSSTVSVIDIATNTVVTTIPGFSRPDGIGIVADGSRVYVANFTGDSVSVIDAATHTIIAGVPVGRSPLGVAVAPGGDRVYVANNNAATVSVIDTTTHTVIATVPVRANPFGIAVGPDGARIYVTHQDPFMPRNTVSVIDTATNRVIADVRVGFNPQGIAVTHDGTRVYVVNSRDDTVSVIDTATHAVTTVTEPLRDIFFSDPLGIAITPDDSKAFVTNNVDAQGSSTVSVIDLATNTLSNEIFDIGASPMGLSITADGSRVYVAGSNLVSVIDTATEELAPGIGGVSDGPGSFGIFIAPNPPSPPPGSLQFSASSYKVAENAGSASIGVTRSGDTGSAVSVEYATGNGTALSISDYTATGGTLTFAAGETSPKSFTVPIINDTAPEAKETVKLTLMSTPNGVSLGTPDTAVLTIVNDDPTPPTSASFNSYIFDLLESGGSALIRVNRTAGNNPAFSIDYATSDGTATAGSDYTAVQGTLTFTSGGPNSLFFSVPILNDSRSESGETLTLTLSNPTNGAVPGSRSSTTLRIINDDRR